MLKVRRDNVKLGIMMVREKICFEDKILRKELFGNWSVALGVVC